MRPARRTTTLPGFCPAVAPLVRRDVRIDRAGARLSDQTPRQRGRNPRRIMRVNKQAVCQRLEGRFPSMRLASPSRFAYLYGNKARPPNIWAARLRTAR